jgi:hypothetical protein
MKGFVEDDDNHYYAMKDNRFHDRLLVWQFLSKTSAL